MFKIASIYKNKKKTQSGQTKIKSTHIVSNHIIYFSFRRIDHIYIRRTQSVNCLSYRKAGLQSKEQYKKNWNVNNVKLQNAKQMQTL